jgi:hypothetical protein
LQNFASSSTRRQRQGPCFLLRQSCHPSSKRSSTPPTPSTPRLSNVRDATPLN